MADPNERNNSVYRIGKYIRNALNVLIFLCYYVGRGKEARLKSRKGYNSDVTKLFEDPGIDKYLFAGNLTLDEAQFIEAREIKKEWGNGILMNRREELTKHKYAIAFLDNLSINPSESDFTKARMDCLKGEDKLTPDTIFNEWFDNLPETKKLDMDLEALDVYARCGENFIPILNFNHYTKITGLYKHQTPMLDGIKDGCLGEKYMSRIDLINADFLDKDQFNPVTKIVDPVTNITSITSKKFDLVITNPPFKDLGEKFLQESAKMLKLTGHLCAIMSPFWRSISVEGGDQRKKTYNILRKIGYFKFIHMYSGTDTKKLFEQGIGQVDSFVWEYTGKGSLGRKTKIINSQGTEFTADLDAYPQAIPVLPTEVYDILFDQYQGLGHYMFTELRKPFYGPLLDKSFIDPVTNQEFRSNQANVDKCRSKKVIIDNDFNNMYVDDIGDVVVNKSYMFKYTTDQEKNCIVKTLTYIMDNGLQEVFKNRSSKVNTYIPRIRISNND